MYIDGFRKNEEQKDDRIGHFFSHEKDGMKEIEKAEEPEEKLIAEHSKDVLAHWQAPEFEVYEQDKRWLKVISFFLVAIIAYAVYANSPIMAITFILIGVVGYIHLGKEARILDFMITYDGIVAGREIFEYERINSFWIFYEPENDTKVISLHIKSYLTPYVHIPIHNEDPVQIREILLDHIHEIKQDHNIVDTLERFLHI